MRRHAIALVMTAASTLGCASGIQRLDTAFRGPTAPRYDRAAGKLTEPASDVASAPAPLTPLPRREGPELAATNPAVVEPSRLAAQPDKVETPTDGKLRNRLLAAITRIENKRATVTIRNQTPSQVTNPRPEPLKAPVAPAAPRTLAFTGAPSLPTADASKSISPSLTQSQKIAALPTSQVETKTAADAVKAPATDPSAQPLASHDVGLCAASILGTLFTCILAPLVVDCLRHRLGLTSPQIDPRTAARR